MSNILNKYLDKLGVKEYSELNEDEKEVYKDWENVLSGRKLTDNYISEFLTASENDIIKELISQNNKDRRDIFLKMQLDMIRKIKFFLSSPDMEREALENNIDNLMK